MIPGLKEAQRSLVFLARARGYTNVAITVREIDHALQLAAKLATRPDEEPAALFFVLALQPGTLLDAWPTFPRLMARNHAGSLGIRLTVTDDELERLARDVCLDDLSFERVRDWFRDRAR